jgi:hypothetical protein
MGRVPGWLEIEVAAHFGCYLYGVAWVETVGGFEPTALYGVPYELPLKDKCAIHAAGPAGEVIGCASFTEVGARKDRQDVIASGYLGSFEVLVEKAVSILHTRTTRFNRLVQLLRRKLESNDLVRIGSLPLGKTGAYLLDQNALAPQDDD